MINNGYYMPGVLGQYQTGGIPAPAQVNNIMPPQGGYQPAGNKQIPAGLGLCQVDGFTMTRQFTDAAGVNWVLKKAAEDSGVDIPDPAYVQVTDFWNHAVPGTGDKVYIYVVEGIRRPRTTNERPVKILYQWFSEYNNPTFTPQMITPAEWAAANKENPGIKRNARGRLRVRTASVLGLTQTDGKRSARENNQEKPGRRLSVQ